MEAARKSETSVDNYFTLQYNPEDKSELHTSRRENLKSHSSKTTLRHSRRRYGCENLRSQILYFLFVLAHFCNNLVCNFYEWQSISWQSWQSQKLTCSKQTSHNVWARHLVRSIEHVSMQHIWILSFLRVVSRVAELVGYSVWLRDRRPGDWGSIPGRGEMIFPLACVSRSALGPTRPPV
jgi:hypothetical protein